MAKNQSLPAHLQEKDSRGEGKLKLVRTLRKPTACQPGPSLSNPRSTNDIVSGLFTCEPDTVTVRHESRPYNWRRLWERLVCWYGKWVDRVSSLYLTVGYRVLA